MPKNHCNHTILTRTKERLDEKIEQFRLKNSYPLWMWVGVFLITAATKLVSKFSSFSPLGTSLGLINSEGNTDEQIASEAFELSNI